MVKLKKKLKFCLNTSCNHKFVLANIYNSKPDGEVKFLLTGKYRRKYYKCEICEHHISDHNYDLNSLYEGNYISSTYGNYDGLKFRFKKIFNLKSKASDNHYRCLRIKEFFKNFKKPFKMLDVGAGLGVFPKKLKNNKFKDIFLIETDDVNINFLKSYLKFKNTFKYKKYIKNQKFDLITLNKVLEHIPDPISFLRKYLKNLKKGGFVYIEVPNVEAKFDKQGYNREEFFIEHHHVFSYISLITMMNKLDLKVLKLKKIVEPSTKYTLFCFAQKMN
jgi:2-polyprenyl-3-methyl-5-hydroxy-6-metoxy-1,4-benzoquinol methylase